MKSRRIYNFSIIFIIILTIILFSSGSFGYKTPGKPSKGLFLYVDSVPDGEINVNGIYSEMEEFVEEINVRGEVPPVYVKYYADQESVNPEKVLSSYSEAAESIDYDGIIIFLLKGDKDHKPGFLYSIHTDKIKKEELEDRIDHYVSFEKLHENSGCQKAIKKLLKDIVMYTTDSRLTAGEKRSIENDKEKIDKIVSKAKFTCTKTGETISNSFNSNFSRFAKKVDMDESEEQITITWHSDHLRFWTDEMGKPNYTREINTKCSLLTKGFPYQYFSSSDSFRFSFLSYEGSLDINELSIGVEGGRVCLHSDGSDLCPDGYCSPIIREINSPFGGSVREPACCFDKGEGWNGTLCKEPGIGEGCRDTTECGSEEELCFPMCSKGKCYPTLSPSNLTKACCPQGKRWSGEKCLDRSEGQECGEEGCIKGLSCNITSGNPIKIPKKKACCPQGELWNGTSCTKVLEGKRCIEGTCKSPLNCNKISNISDYAEGNPKACCPGKKRWNGAAGECKSSGRGEGCEDRSDCKFNLNCNPAFPKTGSDKACCPKHKIWNGTRCKYSNKGEFCVIFDSWEEEGKIHTCKGDHICETTLYNPDIKACCPRYTAPGKERCRSPEKGEWCVKGYADCKGDLSCHPTAADLNKYNKVADGQEVSFKHACCKGKKIWNGTGCRKAEKGDRCDADDLCKGELNCNPGTVRYGIYTPHNFCCPGEKKWNGEECVKKSIDCLGDGSGEVLEISLNKLLGYPGIQKYDKNSEVITPDANIVKEKAEIALIEGKKNHPEWGLEKPTDMSFEQRAQSIFEWIRDNIGYLCDDPESSSCDSNCEGCKDSSLCECLPSWSCDVSEYGDVFLSGEDTLTLSKKCCGGEGPTYHGDCDDFGNLYTSMVRAAGGSDKCVLSTLHRSHLANHALLNGAWTYIDTQFASYDELSWKEMKTKNPTTILSHFNDQKISKSRGRIQE